MFIKSTKKFYKLYKGINDSLKFNHIIFKSSTVISFQYNYSKFNFDSSKNYHVTATDAKRYEPSGPSVDQVIKTDPLNNNFIRSMWSSNQKKVNNININEFEKLANVLNKIIFNWNQRNHCMWQRKMATNEFLRIFENKDLTQNFIANPNNWSLIFDNMNLIFEYQSKNFPDKMPYIGEEKYLFENIESIICNAIKQMSHDMIPDLNLSKLNKSNNMKTIENVKFITDLYESLAIYSQNRSEKLKLIVIESVLNSLATYLQYLIYHEKNIQFSNKKTHQKYLEKLEKYTLNMMEYFKDSNSLDHTIKAHFYNYFSFNREKWSKSVQMLLNSLGSLDKFNNQMLECFSHALRGAIRFNEMSLFFKLCDELYKSRIKHGYLATYFNSHLQYTFYEYILLRQNDPDFDLYLDNLFKSWNILEFIPYAPLIDHLKTSIQNNETKNWLYEDVTIDNKGKCSNGVQIPLNKYDAEILDDMAEKLKINATEETKIKEIYVDAFRKLDEVLLKNKFTVVIDGMNLIYHASGTISNISFIKMEDVLQQLEDLNLSNIFLIFRHHIFKSLGDKLERLKKHHPNLKFFYLNDKIKDDLFIIYSSLRSKSFIVTHDELRNHIERIHDHAFTLKYWLFNKRFSLNQKKTYVIYPNLFKPITQKVNESSNHHENSLNNNKNFRSKWFIPYSTIYSNENEISQYNFPNSYITVEKIKK